MELAPKERLPLMGAKRSRRGRRLEPLDVQELLWLRGVDLSHRPLGYEPNELPDCSTPQFDDNG